MFKIYTRKILKLNAGIITINKQIVPASRASTKATTNSVPILSLASKVNLDDSGKRPNLASLNLEVNFFSDKLKLDIKSHDFTTPTKSKSLPFIWLRSNCKCPACFNRLSQQNELDIAALDTVNTKPIEIAEIKEGNVRGVQLVWHDGHKSEFKLTDLARLVFLDPHRYQQFAPRTLWNRSILESSSGLKRFDFNAFMNDNDTVRQALVDVNTFGAVIIEGVAADVKEMSKVCSRIGPIQSSHFSTTQHVIESNQTSTDVVHSPRALALHTDTTYFKNTAGLEIFHVVRRPSDGGGKTLLADGFYCAEQLKKKDREAFDVLTRTNVEMISYLPNVYHFRTFGPTIETDWRTGELTQVRFNPYVRVCLAHLSSSEIDAYFKAVKKFLNLVREPANELQISLQSNEILMFDNFRVMHGRTAFQGERTIVTAYISRDDWLSKARALDVL